MRDITHRLARASDIQAYYEGRPVPTMQAVTILLDGKPAGLIGVARGPAFFAFFSETKGLEAADLRRLPVMRALKEAMRIVAATPGPVTATSENATLMERLGFKPLNDEGFYLWPT